jgi:hypothetical protein
MKKETLFRYFLAAGTALTAQGAAAESINLAGIVQDQNNSAIEGAEVSLQVRTAYKTQTDRTGAFILNDAIAVSSASSPLSHRYPSAKISRGILTVDYAANLGIEIGLFGINGKRIDDFSFTSLEKGTKKIKVPLAGLLSGVYLFVVKSGEFRAVFTCAVSGCSFYVSEPRIRTIRADGASIIGASPGFRDVLVVSAPGTQTLRRPVIDPSEGTIKIRLMPLGVGYVTPGIPVYSDTGGVGDVTSYGSAGAPEYSQGGACNYGSTKIRYYAAINVNQFPGDGKGQWQDGRICGRCAKIRIRTNEGEERTAVVRIMDKCPDDNCGIDLGGAPTAKIMKSQAGRYSGEWEWVPCDSTDGVSDGPPSLYVKTGSNQWWSLIQVRNGPGSAAGIRVRKSSATEWQNLEWATEAENFFSLPVALLQDDGVWEIEVQWNAGAADTVRLPGIKLSVENAVYPIKQ